MGTGVMLLAMASISPAVLNFALSRTLRELHVIFVAGEL